jgi:hypothetical protein
VLDIGISPVLVVSCADGAGSAVHGGLGAKLACLQFVHLVSSALENGLQVSEISDRELVAWHEQARQRLSLEACLCGLELRDFACTLLTAIVGTNHAVFSQVGDGAIVLRQADAYTTVFWPQNGEYANTTFFLTGADFRERLACRCLAQPVDEVSLLTDGLQPLALHYASRSVHRMFFEPMFATVRSANRPEELEEPLRQFLDSKPVNERTDDDKTLILAARMLPSHVGA